MAKIIFDIQDVYRRAFGYIAPPFPLLGLNGLSEALDVEDRVRNIGGVFKKRNNSLGVEKFMPVKLNDLELPDEPFLSFSGGKKLERTPITGSDGKEVGEITELITNRRIDIRCRGVIVGTDGFYPSDDVRKLKNVFDIQGSLKIENAITNILGIDRIIIEDWRMPGVEGVENAEAYEFTGYAEQSIEEGILN